MASDNATLLLTEGCKSVWMMFYPSPCLVFFEHPDPAWSSCVWCSSPPLKAKREDLNALFSICTFCFRSHRLPEEKPSRSHFGNLCITYHQFIHRLLYVNKASFKISSSGFRYQKCSSTACALLRFLFFFPLLAGLLLNEIVALNMSFSFFLC